MNNGFNMKVYNICTMLIVEEMFKKLLTITMQCVTKVKC